MIFSTDIDEVYKNATSEILMRSMSQVEVEARRKVSLWGYLREGLELKDSESVYRAIVTLVKEDLKSIASNKIDALFNVVYHDDTNEMREKVKFTGDFLSGLFLEDPTRETQKVCLSRPLRIGSGVESRECEDFSEMADFFNTGELEYSVTWYGTYGDAAAALKEWDGWVENGKDGDNLFVDLIVRWVYNMMPVGWTHIKEEDN